MANIPIRSRRRLASSVVGTLGVDTTQAQILATGAKVALNLGGQVKAHREARDKRAEKREKDRNAQSARRDSFVNRSEANRQMVDFNRGLNVIGRDARSQQEYDEQTDQLFNDFSSAFESDDARARFISSAGPKMQSKGDRFFIKNEQDKIDTIQSNVNIAVDKITEDVSLSMSDDQLRFGEKMLDFASSVQDASTVLQDMEGSMSPAAFENFSKEIVSGMATEAVLSLMTANPDQVEPFLNALEDNTPFNKEDIGRIMDQANQYKRKQTELRNRTRVVNNSNLVSDLLLRMTDGEEIPETEINRLLLLTPANGGINATQAGALRASNTTNAREFTGGTAFSHNQLMELYRNIPLDRDIAAKVQTKTLREDIERTADPLREFIHPSNTLTPDDRTFRTKKGEETPEEKEDASNVDNFFAQVAGFRQRVMEARELGSKKGGITDKQAKGLLSIVNPVFRGGVEEIIDQIVKKQTFYTRSTGRNFLGGRTGALEKFPLAGQDVVVTRIFQPAGPGEVKISAAEKVQSLGDAELQDAQMRFSMDLMQRIDEAENNSSKPLSNVQMSTIYQEAKEEFSLRATSDKSQLKVGEMVTGANGNILGQVRGFFLDGEANIETDPSKFRDVKDDK